MWGKEEDSDTNTSAATTTATTTTSTIWLSLLLLPLISLLLMISPSYINNKLGLSSPVLPTCGLDLIAYTSFMEWVLLSSSLCEWEHWGRENFSNESGLTQQERQSQSLSPHPLSQRVYSPIDCIYGLHSTEFIYRERSECALRNKWCWAQVWIEWRSCWILKPTKAERADLVETMLSRQIRTTFGEF